MNYHIKRVGTFFKEYSLTIVSFFIIIIAWELIVTSINMPSYLIPAPSAIVFYLLKPEMNWLMHTFVTLTETILGFGLGIVVGISLAVLLVYSNTARRILYPYVVISQIVPKIAIAPLFLIWFGYGLLPKIIIAFFISFFPIVIDMMSGLTKIDPHLFYMARSLHASNWQVFTKIRWPHSIPYLFSALKVAITLSVIGAIVAEFINANEGLGYVIVLSQSHFLSALAFASVVILVFLGIVLFVVILVLEKIFVKGQR